MISSNLNVSKPVSNNLPQEAAAIRPVAAKSEKTLSKTRVAAALLCGVASVAGGAYSQISLGHPKGFLVTAPLMMLAVIGSKEKVECLNHPWVVLPIMGVLTGSGVVMAATSTKEWWNNLSWESGSYVSFGVSCVLATLSIRKQSKKAEVTVKKEAQNVVKGQ